MKKTIALLALLAGPAFGITQPTLDQHTTANPLPAKIVAPAGTSSTVVDAVVKGPVVVYVRDAQGSTILQVSVTGSVSISGPVDANVTAMPSVVLATTVFDANVKTPAQLPEAVTGQSRTLNAASISNTTFGPWEVPTGSFQSLWETSSMFVDSTARPVFASPAVTMTSHGVVRNFSNTITIYVGGSAVTADSGIPLLPGETMVLDSTNFYGAGMFAVTKAGSGELRLGRW